MGNEQSGHSSSRRRSARSNSSRRPREQEPVEAQDDPQPPPYTLTDASGRSRQRAAAPSGNREPQPVGPDLAASASRVPLNPFQPISSSPNPPAPLPSSGPSNPDAYVGGFRVEVDSSNRFGPSTTMANPAVISTGPPPPLSNVAPGPEHAPVRRSNTREDLLEMLRKYNTVIVVDDSSSMAGKRWRDTRAALAGLANTAAGYDVDGVEIHFLNSPVVGTHMKDGPAVESLFDSIDPDGITPTGEKLEILLLDYILRIEEAQDKDRAEGNSLGAALKAIKPLNLVVLTDGEPSDDPESVIITAAKRLDSRHFPLSQVGIQFVQIGDDVAATEALKELDEALAGAHGIRDMVDTTLYSPVMGQLTPHDIAKMLLGGINRRVDKRGRV